MIDYSDLYYYRNHTAVALVKVSARYGRLHLGRRAW
jgi:hypothetical protein